MWSVKMWNRALLQKQGFSLVEMLVVMGLISILSFIGFRAISHSSPQSEVERLAQEVRQYLEECRIETIGGWDVKIRFENELEGVTANALKRIHSVNTSVEEDQKMIPLMKKRFFKKIRIQDLDDHFSGGNLEWMVTPEEGFSFKIKRSIRSVFESIY